MGVLEAFLIGIVIALVILGIVIDFSNSENWKD